MDQKTIKRLNQLNQKFYQQTAESFSRSRAYYWSGWQKLLPYINVLIAQKKALQVLDIGCGNGRFGQFLSENIDRYPINYTGLDFSKKMLDKADKKLATTDIDYELLQVDIMNNSLTGKLLNKNCNLITAFGLFHHLPSFQFRQKLIKSLSRQLQPEGLLTITFWQFANKKRFQSKIIDPQKVGISPDQLEENDYIMDWRRGKKAYRYCHHLDEKEMKNLIKPLKLNLIDHFLSDGKTDDLNRYLILKRPAI